MTAGAVFSGLGLALATSLAVFGLGWLIAMRVGRVNIVDTVWGLAFVAMAAVSFGWSTGWHADPTRRLLLLVLTTIWGLRLATYLGWRSRGAGEDPRYTRMLLRAGGASASSALTRVFLPQAGVAWFVAAPVIVGMYETSAVNAFVVVGGVLWALGVGFEAVGDAQLAAFKRNPANHGQVLDRGLWRYTRHPNYFGEACVWFGIYLLAAQEWPGAVTVLSPLAMTYFVAAKTGKPLLETHLTDSKPGYADYVRRTSGFLPLPPRKPSPAGTPALK